MANFTGEATIGAAGIAGENVVIENFNGQFTDGTKFFGDVTYPDCIPVSNGFFNNDIGFAMNTYALVYILQVLLLLYICN